jgi:hypothetical protein
VSLFQRKNAWTNQDKNSWFKQGTTWLRTNYQSIIILVTSSWSIQSILTKIIKLIKGKFAQDRTEFLEELTFSVIFLSRRASTCETKSLITGVVSPTCMPSHCSANLVLKWKRLWCFRSNKMSWINHYQIVIIYSAIACTGSAITRLYPTQQFISRGGSLILLKGVAYPAYL